MNLKYPGIAALVAFSSVVAVNAEVITEASNLINDGDYGTALSLLVEEIETNPKSKDYGQLNLMAGECSMALNNRETAAYYFKQAQTKGVADASLYLGRLAYLNYEFDNAATLYGKYSDLKKRAKKEVSEDAVKFKEELAQARSFLERVEDLVVIDSISVDSSEFFSRYRLPASGGHFLDFDHVPEGVELGDAIEPVFSNEWGDKLMWAATDTVSGYLTIHTADKLADGSWHQYSSPELSESGDAAFPYLLADGQTLYLAVKDDSSMGGYDLAVSSRTPATGEYRAPQNLGMPYNSPANDYLLAIDEENSIGWFATDRNNDPDGRATIYVFLKRELRKNIDEDADDLISRARITDYKASWEEDGDYSAAFAAIANNQVAAAAENYDFYFPISSGRILTHWADLKSSEGRTAMKEYLYLTEKLDESQKSQKSLRMRYSKGDRQVRDSIMRAEQEVEQQRDKLKSVRNRIFKAETTN